MAQKLEQGSMVFVDVPTQLPVLSPSKGTLLPLLDLIRRHIETPRGATPNLLIFDDLALFEWIGHSELDISRFARALVSSSVKASVNNPIHSSPFMPIGPIPIPIPERRFLSHTISRCRTRRPRPHCADTSPTLHIPYRSPPAFQREEWCRQWRGAHRVSLFYTPRPFSEHFP